MGGRLARRQRPRAHLEKRMIAHDHAGDKRLLRMALVVLARASARAATVVAVAALAGTLALAESVAAFEPVAVIGGSGGGAGKLAIPLGVATDGAGGLYATEHVNQRVSRFTTAGEFAQAWGFDVMPGGGEGFEVCTRVTECRPGEPGGEAGQLGFPGGIAVDDTGNVFVTDPANDRISQFTTEGSFVRAFGYDVVPGGGKGFEVCTQATGCKPGIAGAHAGQLAGPSYVVSDGAGSIFVTDQANIRVNQFTDAGAFVRAWGFDVVPGGGEGFEICTQATGCKRGEPGGRAGQLSFPTGIAAVGGGLYVADGNSRISQFTTEGSFVRAFGRDVIPGGADRFEVCTWATGCKRGRRTRGDRVLPFPSAVAADPGGAVYVADAEASRILCLGEPGSTPCVRNLFSFRELKLDRSRGTASLGVRVPGPGLLRLRGKGVKSVQMHPEAAGIITLPIRPRYGTRRVLNQEGKARVQVRVTYEPTNGGPHTKTKRIELRKRR